jgi:cobalamin biosynthesis Mg chelatase CobN
MTNDNKLHSTDKNVAPKPPTPPKPLTGQDSSTPVTTSNTKPVTKSTSAKSETANLTASTAAKNTESSKNKPPTDQQQNEQNSTDRVRIRLIPVWLRVLLVLCLLIIVVVVGLIFGYSVLGDGNTSDALKWDTWQHIIDIIRGVE